VPLDLSAHQRTAFARRRPLTEFPSKVMHEALVIRGKVPEKCVVDSFVDVGELGGTASMLRYESQRWHHRSTTLG
jgi:hypothetical protein